MTINDIIALYLLICILYSMVKGINYSEKNIKFNIIDYILILSIPMTLLFITYIKISNRKYK